MSLQRFFLFLFPLWILFLSVPSDILAEKVSLPEQCRDYFNFKDYEKTLQLANKIIEDPANKKNKDLVEEMLYLVNESGEELRDQVQKKVAVNNFQTMATQCAIYKRKFKVQIDISEDGFYYNVIYRHDALKQLVKLNPKSKHIEFIKLKSLLRESQYALDPVYRFKEDTRLIGLYNSYISNYPGSQYLPNLMGRVADLYFNLYEEAITLKGQLGYSDEQANGFYDQSMSLYKSIIRNYPGSDAAASIGEIRINDVKLRKEPLTKSQVLKKLKIGTLVKIVERSSDRFAISNMYEYWYRIRLPDGIEGWVYGVYLNTQYGR